MIKIICGVYGKVEGNRVVAKTAENEPFSLSPEQEERLVKMGYAEYVNVPPCSEPADEYSEQKDNEKGQAEFTIPEYNTDMKADQLKEIGRQLGLSFKPGMTKVDMVAEIDNAVSKVLEDEETDGDLE